MSPVGNYTMDNSMQNLCQWNILTFRVTYRSRVEMLGRLWKQVKLHASNKVVPRVSNIAALQVETEHSACYLFSFYSVTKESIQSQLHICVQLFWLPIIACHCAWKKILNTEKLSSYFNNYVKSQLFPSATEGTFVEGAVKNCWNGN